MKNIIPVIFSSALLASCSPHTTAIGEVKKAETTTPSVEISEGKSLFEAHCGTCHKLPIVSRYSKEKWQKILPVMCKKAKLDASQENKLTAYVNWKLQQQ
jgi:mono/diheme cytochrome c family protein